MKYTSIIMSDAISTKHRHITKFSKDGGAEGMRGRREREKKDRNYTSLPITAGG